MALSVGGTPITPEQLATLQADLGIVVAEEITARLTSLVSTDDTIFLRAGVPHLAAASVIADYVGVSGGTQTLTPARFNNSNTFYGPTLSGGAVVLTPSRFDNAQTFYGPTLSGGAVTLTPSRFDNSQTFYAPTVALAGGSPAYIADTYTAGTDSITITRPTGAGASDTLTAIVWTDIGGQNINTMAAPSGWTVNDGATNPTENRSARVFTAPGDVSNLTFAQTGIRGIVCFATSANVRNTEFEGIDYSGPSNSTNRNAPAVTAVADDLGVSVYIQYDAGSEGAPTDPGSPQAGWTRRYLRSSAVPYISILSRASLTAGSTGTISHDMTGNFSGRFVFSGTYGA